MSKVIDFNEFKNRKIQEKIIKIPLPTSIEVEFTAAQQANKANEERLKKERQEANESVKRSYRLKDS